MTPGGLGTTNQSVHAGLELHDLELHRPGASSTAGTSSSHARGGSPLRSHRNGAEGVGPLLRQRGEGEVEVHLGCISRGAEAEARSSEPSPDACTWCARGSWAGS